MTDKLPAGNTGRHEDSILWDRLRADLANLGASYGELPQGHYHEFGSIEIGYRPNCIHCGLHHESDPERYRPTCIRRSPALTPQSPLTPFGEALQSLSHGLAGVATSQRRDSEPVDKSRRDGESLNDWFDRLWSYNSGVTDVMLGTTSSGTGKFDIAFERAEPDYDAILLAARKKREALAWMDEPLTDDERDICHAMWDEQDRAEKVSAAMSRPLDWEPRVGHKGVETG